MKKILLSTYRYCIMVLYQRSSSERYFIVRVGPKSKVTDHHQAADEMILIEGEFKVYATCFRPLKVVERSADRVVFRNSQETIVVTDSYVKAFSGHLKIVDVKFSEISSPGFDGKRRDCRGR